MQTLKLDKTAVEQAFRPCQPLTNKPVLHRLIYSARTERYYTVDLHAGKFVLMAHTDMPVRLMRQTFPAWFPAQELETWADVLDWAQKFKAVVRLPEPVSQVDVLVSIYRLVFGDDWDKAVKIDGWPECNKNTWTEICKMFQEFDRTHHPDVLPGGRWMNNGFSSAGKDLSDWEVRLCGIVTAETPYRYVIRQLILDDGTFAERYRIVKEYQGFDARDDLDTQYTWEDAAGQCASPELLRLEFSVDNERGYNVWTSQWVTVKPEVACAA